MCVLCSHMVWAQDPCTRKFYSLSCDSKPILQQAENRLKFECTTHTEISHLKETVSRIEYGLGKVQDTQGTMDGKLRLMVVRLGVEEADPDNKQEIIIISEWPTSYSPFDKLCALTEVVALRTTGYRRWYDGINFDSAPPSAPDGTRRLDVPPPKAHLGGIDSGLAGMDLDREPGAPKGVSKGLPPPTLPPQGASTPSSSAMGPPSVFASPSPIASIDPRASARFATLEADVSDLKGGLGEVKATIAELKSSSDMLTPHLLNSNYMLSKFAEKFDIPLPDLPAPNPTPVPVLPAPDAPALQAGSPATRVCPNRPMEVWGGGG